MPGRIIVEGQAIFFIPDGQILERQPGYRQLPEEFRNMYDVGHIGIAGITDGFEIIELDGRMQGTIKCTTKGFNPRDLADWWVPTNFLFNLAPPFTEFPGGVRIEPITTEFIQQEMPSNP